VDLAGRAAAAVDNARLYERLRAEDRRKDEFLATLAHELRNPLAPIRTGLALLRATTDQATLERTRDVMDRQLGHMVRLIDDLLDLSRVTRGAVQLELERLDLWSVVGHAVEASRPLLDAAGVQLVVRLPETPIILEADRTRMTQIFSNILNNAAKFTDRGGRVELAAIEEGPEVLISVADTGTGIPREMLSQIFEMFVQVRETPMAAQTGLGIGLTLVQRLVQLHHGRVWAESAGPGGGSTFFVRMPRAVAAGVAQVPPPAESKPGVLPVRRVLVVDDNVDAAEMLAALVALDGHEVRTAANGAAALEILRDFRPDVAFLDIGLPGMSGYELAMTIRRDPRLRGLLLVAVTGWGQAEDRQKSKAAGFDDHLTKPVDPGRVLAVVVGS
jgi:CheY-like chemotaxis protein/two-component sensor histidine kinase